MLSNKSKRSSETDEEKKSQTTENTTEQPYAVGKPFYYDKEEFSRRIMEGSAVLSYCL